MGINFSIINQYFDHVYVVNLQNRSDRKVAMLQKLSRLSIKAEFVNAIDGSTIENKSEYQKYFNQPIGLVGSHPLEIAHKRKLISSPGAWAYLKTTLGVLKDAKKRGFDRILFFNDDVLFAKDFEARFEQAIKQTPQDWKLLYLGATQHVWNVPGDLSYPNENKLTIDKNEAFYYPYNTDGSFAVGIDASIIDLLIEDILKMNCSFDSGPLRSVIKAYPNKCFVLNPNLVIADVSESDIRGERNQKILSEKLKWNLDQYEFPFKMDLVSVIMPLHNAEKTVDKAIRSILMQTYCELEIIVVDDASTDDSKDVVKKIINEDARVKLIALEKNLGVSLARNEGLKNSNGKLIAFQDSDDLSLKNRIEKQLIPIYEKSVLFTVSQIYRSRCTHMELDIYDQDKMISLVESRMLTDKNGKYNFLNRAHIGLVTTIFKRSVFEEYGLFEDHRIGSDLEFIERILFFKLKCTFDEKQNGHSILNDNQSISKTFYNLNKVLYVCAEFSENNLTTQAIKNKEAIALKQQKFRNKYTSRGIQVFPKLPSKTYFPSIQYNTLNLDSLIEISISEYQKLFDTMLKSQQKLELQSETKHYTYKTDLDAVYSSWSWKITTPFRWIGKYIS